MRKLLLFPLALFCAIAFSAQNGLAGIMADDTPEDSVTVTPEDSVATTPQDSLAVSPTDSTDITTPDSTTITTPDSTTIETPDSVDITPGETPDSVDITPGETPDSTIVTPGETPDSTIVTPGETPDSTIVTPGETPDSTIVTPGETPDSTIVIPGETPEDTIAPPYIDEYVLRDDIILNIENAKVKRYLTNVIYGYGTYSSISSYAKNIVTADEWPEPAVIDFDTPVPDSTLITVRNVSDSTDTYFIHVADSDTVAFIYNLIPRQRYRYDVIRRGVGRDDTLLAGHILTQGNLRMLRFPSMHNVRDFGGRLVKNGATTDTVQYRLIYRGSRINPAYSEQRELDKAELKRIGIRAEVDLRDLDTIPAGSAIADDIDYLYEFMHDNWDPGVIPVYNTEIAEAYTFVVNCLRHRKPVYFHCTYGADRTGTLAALIEASIGVSLSDLYKDYELSSFSGFVGERKRIHINERLINALKYKSGDNLRDLCREYMVNVMGISEEDINDLTDILLGKYNYPEDTELPPIPDTPADDYVTCIDSTTPQALTTSPQTIHDLQGRHTPTLRKGLNIIRHPDGTVKKILK